MTTMGRSIISRPMRGDADFWKMRDLVIRTVPTAPVGFNWDVRRLDGKRFYDENAAEDALLKRPLQLWEAEDGELVGFVLAEGRGDAHLQVHPDYRHLEGGMVAWAERELAVPTDDGQARQLEIYVYEYDALRQRLLSARGFARTEYWGVIRHMRLGKQPLARSKLAAGYMLRTTDPGTFADCQKIADLLNAAFGRTFHNAEEYRNFTRLAPCFRQELDLVAEAPDGRLAAYAALPYDEANRRGIFEPVCTHPDHRRKGLAQALMQEGLLRLRALEAIDVTVDTGDMTPANCLYDSLGFTEAYRGYAWRKIF